jgi:ATP-binding cassette subfamily B protein
VLVLDHGRIAQRGTHAELIAQPGPYREIYDLQLRDQEEAAADIAAIADCRSQIEDHG